MTKVKLTKYQAATLIAGIGAVALVALYALGSPELRAMMESRLEWLLAMVVAPYVQAFFTKDTDGDGTPDVFDDTPNGPPPAGGTALLVLALVLSAVTQGCGASVVSMHARAAIGTAGVLAAAGTVADEARRQALDRVEAEHPTDPEHDAALIAEAARWRPAGATLDLARSAQLSWVAAVQAAHLAGEGAGLLPSLTPLAGRVAWLYAEAVRLFAALGTDLPTAPAFLLSLGGAR